MTDRIVFPVFDHAKPPQLQWVKAKWDIDHTLMRKYAHDGRGNTYYIDLPPLPETPKS